VSIIEGWSKDEHTITNIKLFC